MNRSGSLGKVLIAVIIVAALAVGAYFGKDKLLGGQDITDESKWTTISQPQFSIKVPSAMKEGKMLTVIGSDVEQLCFYTSEQAGFDVNYYAYTAEEKASLGGLSAKEYEAAMKMTTRKINGQTLTYKARDGKNYVFTEYNRHSPNYIGKSDEVWYIEATYPTADGYYQVDTYCAQTDKDALREYMMKWLDSFTVK